MASFSLATALSSWLADNDLAHFLPHLQALGVRSHADLSFVTSGDLAHAELPLIDCRRFLHLAKTAGVPSLHAWLARNDVAAYISQFESLGVRALADVALVTLSDLEAMGMAPVDCRRVLTAAGTDFTIDGGGLPDARESKRRKTSRRGSLLSLSDDVLVLLLRRCDLRSLLMLRVTCRRLRALCEAEGSRQSLSALPVVLYFGDETDGLWLERMVIRSSWSIECKTRYSLAKIALIRAGFSDPVQGLEAGDVPLPDSAVYGSQIGDSKLCTLSLPGLSGNLTILFNETVAFRSAREVAGCWLMNSLSNASCVATIPMVGYNLLGSQDELRQMMLFLLLSARKSSLRQSFYVYEGHRESVSDSKSHALMFSLPDNTPIEFYSQS